MSEEEFRKIPDFPDYEISRIGKVKSLRRFVTAGSKTGVREVEESFLLPKQITEKVSVIRLRRGKKTHCRSINKILREVFPDEQE